MEEEQVDGLDSEAPATDPIPLGVRLFLIPFVIVLVCGAVLLIGRLLAGGPTTASEYLDDIRTAGGNRRWQAAYELSTLLDRTGMQVDAQVADQMVRLFEDVKGRDPQVRSYLALCLGKVGNPLAVPALIDALPGGEEPEIRLYAAWALGAIGDTTAAAPLAALVSDEDAGLRTMVAYSLGSLGGQRGLDTLAGMLEDPERDVRWNAATGLARQGSAQGLLVLGEMLDRDAPGRATMQPRQQEDVLLNAIQALEMLGSDRYDERLRVLENQDPSQAVRQAAREALAGD